MGQHLNKRVLQLLQSVDEFGVTHIVTADGNMEDEHLAFVENEMATCHPPATADERELIGLLKAMPVEDRFEAWEAVVYGWQSGDE